MLKDQRSGTVHENAANVRDTDNEVISEPPLSSSNGRAVGACVPKGRRMILE